MWEAYREGGLFKIFGSEERGLLERGLNREGGLNRALRLTDLFAVGLMYQQAALILTLKSNGSSLVPCVLPQLHAATLVTLLEWGLHGIPAESSCWEMSFSSGTLWN